MTPERFTEIINRYHHTDDADTRDLIAHVFQLRDEVMRSRCAFDETARALVDERRTHGHVVARRGELIDEVRAAEAAARDYRQLLLDAELYGEIPIERCNQRADLDERHAAVIDDDRPLDYAPTGPVIVTPTD